MLSFRWFYTNKYIIEYKVPYLRLNPTRRTFKGAICMIFSFLSNCIIQTCRGIFSFLWKYFCTPCFLQTKQLKDKNTWNRLFVWKHLQLSAELILKPEDVSLYLLRIHSLNPASLKRNSWNIGFSTSVPSFWTPSGVQSPRERGSRQFSPLTAASPEHHTHNPVSTQRIPLATVALCCVWLKAAPVALSADLSAALSPCAAFYTGNQSRWKRRWLQRIPN